MADTKTEQNMPIFQAPWSFTVGVAVGEAVRGEAEGEAITNKVLTWRKQRKDFVHHKEELWVLTTVRFINDHCLF